MRLGDCCKTNLHTYSDKEKWSLIRYLDTGSITEGRIDEIQTLYPGVDKIPSRARRKASVGDILFSTVRPNQKHYGIIEAGTENLLVSTGFTVVTVDTTIADPYFIYYYLTQSSVIESLQAIAEQSTSTYPSIKPSDIEDIELDLPELETQKKIGSTLRMLDRKIALNEEINDNLEQQAQSYFQELFVDNADPEWTTGTISDLGTVVGGSTPSKAKPEYYTESGIAWITPKDLSNNKSKFVSHGENDITELGLRNSSASIMPEGTVLFSSRAPIGYIAIAAGEVTTNQGFKSVVPKPEIGTPFVYFFLKNTLPVIEGMASGSTFKEVSGSTMKNVPAVIPDAETLAKFSDFCAPIFAQQRILEEQNQSLATLRDNLLPKLMSGEIDVSAVQL
ncbi:restriction endonuclease subunit S [Candidatus Pseudoruminococcus sp.]|uniref:restriction endonuclease subunit S n=2 Tax=Eubacteriales TaxID=186802 RepID=UPI003999FF5D